MPGKAKGSPKTGGRVAGTPNKVTKELKDMILGALDDAGGQAYLATQARDNPGAFLTLVGKVLPKEITGKDGGPVQVNSTISVIQSIMGEIDGSTAHVTTKLPE